MRRRQAKRGSARSHPRGWLLALGSALRSPTAKQKEAYGRYLHTLSAAGMIGAVTLIFPGSFPTTSAIVRATTMLLAAVILFLSGTVLIRED